MSKKRITKAWESDEELLNDVPTIPRESEPTISGDAKMLDEDALLAVDETGMRIDSVFANSSKITRQKYQHDGTTVEPYDEEMSELNSNSELTYRNGSELEHNIIGIITQEGTFGENQEDMSITEFGQEQPMDQEEQAKKSENCEGGIDSDVENSHDCDKSKNERKGVISLTPTTRRDSIPEKLEINKEQAAQLKQFLSDKSHKGRGKTRGQGRYSSNSLLGSRPVGLQQNPQMILGQFLQGVVNPQPRMGFNFQGGPHNRGPFPGGPFNMRPLNQRIPFSGRPPNTRGPLNMSLRASQSVPGLNLPNGRFIGTPNQRGPFVGPQPLGSHRMPTGPQPLRGIPLNQLRLQGFPNQRVANPNQFRQQPPLLGQQGIRVPGMPGPRPLIGNAGPRPLIGNAGPRPLIGSAGPRQLIGNAGPRQLIGNAGPRQLIGSAGPRSLLGNAGPRPLFGSAGPRPLIGNPGPDMRFARPNRPQGNPQLNQSIPSIVNQVANALQSSLGFQQMRPGQPNMMPNAGGRPPGLMQNMNRFQHPTGQLQGTPRFMGRNPGPFGNSPMFRGGQQPLLGGQRMQMFGNQKIFINPRFQGPQTAFGAPGMGRAFRMGIPAQQRRAKILLEKAKQTQNKHAITAPGKLTGIKRKSTGGEDVPTKVGKPDESTLEISETESTTVVQAEADNGKHQ